MKRMIALILIIGMLAALPLFAQEPSPYKRFIGADYFIYAGAAASGLGASLIGHSMAPLSVDQIEKLDRNDINRIDRPATYHYSKSAAEYSDWGMRTCMILPLFAALDNNMRGDAATLALLYFETMTLTGAATELAKVGVKRIRPYAYNPNVPLESKTALDTRKSFFSGHTSTSFAGAVFFAKAFNDYHPQSPWRYVVWAASLTAASSVAWARVKAGKHFPTDVVAGALVGGAIGYFIPEMHKQDEKKSNMSIGSQQGGIVLSLKFEW